MIAFRSIYSRAASLPHRKLILITATLVFLLCAIVFGWTLPGGEMLVLLLVITFVCELIDSTFGMGYGTLLMPILIFMGFEPRDIVPTILISEFLTGVGVSFGHHLVGNVDFRIRSRAWNTAVILGGVALVTSPIAVLLVVHISSAVIVTAIGYLILAEGLAIIALHNSIVVFSWFRVSLLGAFASFIKALSGGGYGPLVTGGQVLIGVEGRHAVAITSFAETLTCFVALVVYFVGGGTLNYGLLWPVLLGAFCSIPLSLTIVHEMNVRTFRPAIGVITAIIGLFLVLFQG